MGDLLLAASSEFRSEQKAGRCLSPYREMQGTLQRLSLARIPKMEDTISGHIRTQGTVCPGEEEVLSRETGEHRAEKRYLRELVQ